MKYELNLSFFKTFVSIKTDSFKLKKIFGIWFKKKKKDSIKNSSYNVYLFENDCIPTLNKFLNKEYIWVIEKEYCLGILNYRHKEAKIFVNTEIYTKKSMIMEGIIKNVFRSLLAELLWLNDILLIHSSCVVKNNLGILIPAPIGGGKTFTTLYFIRNGYKVISGDLNFLFKNNDNFYIGGIPMPLSFHKDTDEFFPDFKSLVKSTDEGRSIWLEDGYGIERNEIMLKGVCVPVNSNSKISEANHLKQNVFLRMIPTINSFFPPNSDIINKKMDFLSEIVSSTNVYIFPKGNSLKDSQFKANKTIKNINEEIFT